MNHLAQDEAALATQPARSLLLLSQVLEAHDEKKEAEKVLKRAWRLRPDDFWICSQLARNSEKERVRFASAAVAIRPENAWGRMALAEALAESNEPVPFSFEGGGMRGSGSYTDDPASWALAETHPQRNFPTPPPFPLNAFIIRFYKKIGLPHCDLTSLAPYRLKLNGEIIEQCREAVRLNPNDATLHCWLARVLIHTEGKLDEAIEEYRQSMRLQHEDGFKRDQFAHDWARGEFGNHLALNGRTEEAIRVLEEIAHPDTAVRVFLGTLLQKAGRLQAASSIFREALLWETGHIDLEVRAAFLRATAKPDEAIAAFRERLRLPHQEPFEEIFTIAQLGDLCRSQGKFDGEISIYLEAILKHPEVPELHGLLGHALKRQRKPYEAKAEFAKQNALYRAAIDRNPELAENHRDLAGALFDQGMWDEALKELREAFRIGRSSDVYSRTAMAFYSQGNVNQAITLSREAVQVDPRNAEAHYNLGYYLLDSGDADAALAEFLEAKRIDPEIPAYLDSLGLAHFARGELKEALVNLQQATDLMGKLSPHPSFEAHLRLVKRLSALEPRLDTIVRGQEVPADSEGKLDLAELCRVKHRFDAAARFYRDAFGARPALADDLLSRHRLHAAMAAARASSISPPAKDDLSLEDVARAGWRRPGPRLASRRA